MSQVSIHKIKNQSYQEIQNTVYQIIRDLGGLRDIIKPGDRVLINPNLTAVPEDRLSGAVTRWEVVKAIAQRVAQEGATPVIAESASAGEDTDLVYLRCEYSNISEAGYAVVDLKKQRPIRIPVKEGQAVRELLTWDMVAEADAIISVPVLKTHDQTEVTLGMKNLKGLILDCQKKMFHRIGVVQGVCDIVSALKPSLTIIDGTFGQEGIGPVFGDTVKMDVILGSKDVVACDAAGACVMGYLPEEVPMIAAAAERGLGEMKPEKIRIIGEPLRAVRRRFVRAGEVELSGVAPYRLLMDEGTCTGCRNTVRCSMKEFEHHRNAAALEGRIIAAGPMKQLPKDSQKENTILVGNCTKHLKDHGTWIPGCPPENEYLIRAILGKL